MFGRHAAAAPLVLLVLVVLSGVAAGELDAQGTVLVGGLISLALHFAAGGDLPKRLQAAGEALRPS